MTLLLTEGFEHIRTATDLGRRFPEANSGVASTLPSQVGMLASSKCLRIDNTTTIFRTAALAPGSTMISFGVGFRALNPANSWPQIYVLNGSNAEQLSIHTIAFSGQMRFRLMRGATELYLSDLMPMGVYYFIELQATIDSSAGSWIFRINEMTVGQGTGNTANAGGSGFSKVTFNLSTVAGSGNYIELDNLYIGDAEADLLGIVSIEACAPVDNGSLVALSLIGAPANFQAVDDALTGGADDNTSYVELATDLAVLDLGVQLDLYKIEKLRDTRSSILDVAVSIDLNNSDVASQDVTVRHYDPSKRKQTLGAVITIAGSSGYVRKKKSILPSMDPDTFDRLEFGPADQSGSFLIP